MDGNVSPSLCFSLKYHQRLKVVDWFVGDLSDFLLVGGSVGWIVGCLVCLLDGWIVGC